MRFGFAIVALAAASASAFAPSTRNPPSIRNKYNECHVKPAGFVVSRVAPDMMASRSPNMVDNRNPIVCERPRQSKRIMAMALKILGKVVGVVGTIVLATGGAPGVALAAPGGVGTTKNVVDVVQTIDQVHRLVAMAAAAISSVTACIIVKRLLDTLIRVDAKATKDKIAEVFPGALKNKQLVYRVREALRKYDYGSDSLLVTSLSPDTVNRALEKDFGHVFKENYNIGGLAGFPFGGATAFATMAGHIPDGGSCLVVYASNVGVDSKGNVGTVESSGRTNGIPCCGSSIAAAAAVAAIAKKGGTKTSTAPATTTVPLLDAQQHSVVDMLLPYADRLETANDKMVELPYCVYDAQKKMMASVVTAGRRAIVGTANIAVLGGIQINTPEDQSDYYLPLSFEVFNKKGRKLEDLTVLL